MFERVHSVISHFVESSLKEICLLKNAVFVLAIQSTR